MADVLVVSEQDIRKKIDLNGMSLNGSEEQVRAVLEKMGIDFGRSTFVHGESPNRKWSNNRNAFYPSVTDSAPATPAQEPAKPAEPSQGQNEIAALKAELAEIRELKAQIAKEKAQEKPGQDKPYSVPTPKKA